MYYENFDRIEKVNNKDSLLICIGDSWTWGDSLSELLRSTQHMYEEVLMSSKHSYNERKQYCFGNHLSNYLDSDWINIACPGESNFYILNKLKECLNNKELSKYNKIYYVIVLTETGRELHKLDEALFEGCKNLDKLLEISENYIFNEIKKLNLQNCILTRNFTKSFTKDKYKSWIEINDGSYDILPTGFITQKALRDNESIISKLPNWKTQVINQYNKVEKLYNFLDASKLHHKKSTKHPTKESHKLWADYLYKIIKDNK